MRENALVESLLDELSVSGRISSNDRERRLDHFFSNSDMRDQFLSKINSPEDLSFFFAEFGETRGKWILSIPWRVKGKLFFLKRYQPLFLCLIAFYSSEYVEKSHHYISDWGVLNLSFQKYILRVIREEQAAPSKSRGLLRANLYDRVCDRLGIRCSSSRSLLQLFSSPEGKKFVTGCLEQGVTLIEVMIREQLPSEMKPIRFVSNGFPFPFPAPLETRVVERFTPEEVESLRTKLIEKIDEILDFIDRDPKKNRITLYVEGVVEGGERQMNYEKQILQTIDSTSIYKSIVSYWAVLKAKYSRADLMEGLNESQLLHLHESINKLWLEAMIAEGELYERMTNVEISDENVSLTHVSVGPSSL